MATYKFKQFKTEITNPTITADIDSLGVQPTNNTISISITLETTNSKLYGVELTSIAVQNLSYEGYDNLMLRVMENLIQYEI